MGNDTLTVLEDAVLEALRRQIGPDVKTLKTYQGDWRSDLRSEGWRLPALLVMLRQSQSEQVSTSSYDLALEFRLQIIVSRLRGDDAARRQEGGIYQLLAGIRQALWHQDLGLDVQPFTLVREEPLGNQDEYTIYEAIYRTTIIQDF